MINEKSEKILSRMHEMNSGFYTPVVVVGSGPAGSVAANTISGVRPDITPLILEAGENIGGIFAKFGYEKSVFEMNTPSLEDDNPNSLGSLAAVATTHVGGEAYTPNHEMGGVTTLTGFIGAEVVNKCRFISAERTGRESSGIYKVTMFDSRAGKEVSFLTDHVINTTGPGEVNFGVPLEGETKDIVEEALDHYDSGKVPRVMTHDMFYILEGQSNPEFDKALDESEVLMIGGGHSAATVAMHLTGKGGNQEEQISYYQPKHIDWAGLKAESVEEFLYPDQLGGSTQARYASLAADLPKRKGDEGRITGINAYVIGFRNAQDSDKVIAIFQDKSGNTFEKAYDYIVTAPGLTDLSREPYADVPTTEITHQQDIYTGIRDAFYEPNTTIVYEQMQEDADPQLQSLTITGVKKRKGSTLLTYVARYNDGTRRVKQQKLEDDEPEEVEEFFNRYADPFTVARIHVTEEQPEFFNTDGDAIPVASRIPGENIHFAGSNSRAPLSDAEIQWMEEYPHNINPIALSLNMPKVQLLALKVADAVDPYPSSDLVGLEQHEIHDLPPLETEHETNTPTIKLNTRKSRLPLEARTTNLVKVLASQECSHFGFPTEFPSLSFKVRQGEQNGEDIELNIDVEPNLSGNENHKRLLQKLILENPLMQSVCCHLCGEYPNGFQISIPVQNGAIDVANIMCGALE